MDLAEWSTIHSTSLESLFDTIAVNGLNKLHLSPDDIHPRLPELAAHAGWTCIQSGESFLGRPIHSLRWGTGPLSVLAWSQMHGDEPTATASLLDVLSMFAHPPLRPWLDTLKTKLCVTVVPMLNPDGAALRTRENGQGIDINRDAMRLQTPEGRLLHGLLTNEPPDFALNLHDQDRSHRVGGVNKSTAFALMVPPSEPHKPLTPARKQAMGYLGQFLDELTANMPHNDDLQYIAQYDDTYSPRGFGDFAASLHIPTVLVESGIKADDWTRQRGRYLTWRLVTQCLNWLALSAAFPDKISRFQALPDNCENQVFDLVIRNVSVVTKQHFVTDIAINVDMHRGCGSIVKLGDLSQEIGLKEFDAKGCVWSNSDTQQSPLASCTEQILDGGNFVPCLPEVGDAQGTLLKDGAPYFQLKNGDLINVKDGTHFCGWPQN